MQMPAVLTNDAQQYRDDCNDQQDVNETAQREGGDHSEQPQNDQDNGDGVQHGNTFLVIC